MPTLCPCPARHYEAAPLPTVRLVLCLVVNGHGVTAREESGLRLLCLPLKQTSAAACEDVCVSLGPLCNSVNDCGRGSAAFFLYRLSLLACLDFRDSLSLLLLLLTAQALVGRFQRYKLWIPPRHIISPRTAAANIIGGVLS